MGALKATMHDARGEFKSPAAEAYASALAEFKAEEEHPPAIGDGANDDRANILERLLSLAGGSDFMNAMRKAITVNYAGERPVFASLRTAAPGENPGRGSIGGGGGKKKKEPNKKKKEEDEENERMPLKDAQDSPNVGARAIGKAADEEAAGPVSGVVEVVGGRIKRASVVAP